MPAQLNYFREVKAELEKVVWPTREQTIRYSILVIIVALATGLLLGGLDTLLTIFTDYLVKSKLSS
jgi:preprotein translocase subunit SecE